MNIMYSVIVVSMQHTVLLFLSQMVLVEVLRDFPGYWRILTYFALQLIWGIFKTIGLFYSSNTLM